MLIDSIINKIPIEKGWSGDRKFCATAFNEKKYFLRISPIEKYDRRKREFERMCEVFRLGIPMPEPLEFGVCEEGVYTIESFVEGVDLEEYLFNMPPEIQYTYGYEAGKILAKIHTLPAPENAISWETRFNAKIDRKIEMYQKCELKYANDRYFFEYINNNRHLLSERVQSYQHGDYHIGNMMADETHRLVIIDFDRDDYGDPWEEFNRIVWCAESMPPFAAGMVDGYFSDDVPEAFWRILALYICSNTLGSLPWAITYGEKEIATMKNQAQKVLAWYNNFNTVVPSWYSEKNN